MRGFIDKNASKSDPLCGKSVKPMNWVARGNMERGIKRRAEVLGQTIILDPMESKLLHAMAEAVGIPNPFGPKTPKKQEPK
jgi:hypothetical protein